MSSLKEVDKLEGLTTGQWFALAKHCGGLEVVKDILRGRKKVRLEDARPPMFNKAGRYNPYPFCPHKYYPAFTDHFELIKPRLTNEDYSMRLARLNQFFGPVNIEARQFYLESEEIISALRKSEHLDNILNGTYLPIVIPKLPIGTRYDLAEKVSGLITAIKKSYEEAFPRRRFVNSLDTFYDVATYSGTGQGEVLDISPCVAIYFPSCFQGFNFTYEMHVIEKIRENGQTFISLSGIDVFIALIMYPDILAQSKFNPILYPAGLSLPVKEAFHKVCFVPTDKSLELSLVKPERDSHLHKIAKVEHDLDGYPVLNIVETVADWGRDDFPVSPGGLLVVNKDLRQVMLDNRKKRS